MKKLSPPKNVNYVKQAITQYETLVPDAEIKSSFNRLAKFIHHQNDRWWRNPKTRRWLKRNKGEMLMLMVSEIAEAMEGERKDLMDTHLPHRKMVEVEMADLFIRALDYCGAYGFDIGGAIVEKLAYNRTRVDHSWKARQSKHGKKF